MSLKEIQEEIIEEFEIFEDPMEKYNYLIEIGKSLPEINEKYRNDEYVIKGCQSRVWLHAELNEDKINFTADGDAIIVKGLVALLVRVLSGQKPADIMNADLYFIDSIGLKESLSPTRANGLLAMVKQMKLYGMAYNAKMNQ